MDKKVEIKPGTKRKVLGRTFTAVNGVACEACVADEDIKLCGHLGWGCRENDLVRIDTDKPGVSTTFKAFTKPESIVYMRIHDTYRFHIGDDLVTAKPGQLLLTPAKGHKFLIDESEFTKRYECIGVDSGYCWESPKIVEIKVINRGSVYNVIIEGSTVETINKDELERKYDILG